MNLLDRVVWTILLVLGVCVAAMAVTFVALILSAIFTPPKTDINLRKIEAPHQRQIERVRYEMA